MAFDRKYPEIQQKALEPLKFGAVHHISHTALEDSIGIEHHFDDMTGNMVTELRARVMAEKIDEHTKTLTFNFSFQIPSSWWDDFKERRLPSWFTERFPVRYKSIYHHRTRKVSFKKYAKYPNMRPMPRGQEFFPIYESMLEP